MSILVVYIFTLILSVCAGNAVSHDNLKLELVQVLFRHGARTPLQRSLNYFSSVNQSIYKDWGIGKLTSLGKQQVYNLGSFLRSRYKDFLSANYKSEDVYAYSSAEDRTKMTMALVLAGLYPPLGSIIWNPSLLWTPVPFKYTPRDLDVILRGYETPKFVKLHQQVQASDEHKQKLKKYADALSILDEKTGAKATANFSTLTYIFDILYANEHMNVSSPDWYTPEVRQTLLEVQEQDYDDRTSTEEMRKIGIGLLVRMFVENMNLNKTDRNPRKIYLYSGHDSDIALYTRAHNIPQFRYPHFGNALIFEKWHDSKDNVFVKMFAWTGSDNLLSLKLGAHEDFCPIEDYLKIATPVMLPDSEVDDIIKDFSIAQLKNFFFNDEAVSKLQYNIV